MVHLGFDILWIDLVGSADINPYCILYTDIIMIYLDIHTFLQAAAKHDFGNLTLRPRFGFVALPQELEDYEEKRQRYRLRVGPEDSLRVCFP